MGVISDFLSHQHREREDLFGRTEASAASGHWEECGTRLARLARDLESHFAAEEQVLFAAFETHTGMTEGPTAMMRLEHDEMRGLLADLDDACARKAREAFLGVSETLGVLLQQHHMKEESILFPMCDQALAAEAGTLVDRMAGIEASG